MRMAAQNRLGFLKCSGFMAVAGHACGIDKRGLWVLNVGVIGKRFIAHITSFPSLKGCLTILAIAQYS